MDLKVIHDTILFIIRKEQNTFISHEEIDQILDRAQLVLLNQYHTNPKIPAMQQAQLLGESQRIEDALSPFKAKYTFTNGTTASGIVTLPSDYLHLLALYTTTYNSTLGRNVYSAVQILSESELIERLESQVIPVTSEDPIGIMNNQNKIQLFPESPSSGAVFYIKRPTPPVFSYTQSGRSVSYDQLSSVQMAWRDTDILNIIVIALSYIGINISSADVMQFAELKTQQGQ